MTSVKPPTRRIELEDVLLWLFAFMPVLAWIVAQQVSFLIIRSICTTGQRWILFLVMGSALATAVLPGAASWMNWKGLASKKTADRIVTYRRFMALGGVFLAGISAVSILSLMIPAALHRVCD